MKIILILLLFAINITASEDIFNYDYKKECSDCIVNKKCTPECEYEPEKKFDSKYNIFSFGGGFSYTGYEKYIFNIESVYTYKYFSASLNYKNMFQLQSNDDILTTEITVGTFIVGGFGTGYNFTKKETIKNVYIGATIPIYIYRGFSFYLAPFYRYNSSNSLSFYETGIMLKFAFFECKYMLGCK